MTKFSIKGMNVNFVPMHWEVMDIEALSVLQFIIAVNLMPPASAFKLVQSLVASIEHYAVVVFKL